MRARNTRKRIGEPTAIRQETGPAATEAEHSRSAPETGLQPAGRGRERRRHRSILRPAPVPKIAMRAGNPWLRGSPQRQRAEEGASKIPPVPQAPCYSTANRTIQSNESN